MLSILLFALVTGIQADLNFTVPYTPGYPKVLVEIVAKPLVYNRIADVHV
jgi:hypothetical protein